MTDRPRGSEPDDKSEDSERRRLDSVVPELLKRWLEAGAERLVGSPESVKQFINELKLPKDALHVALGQADEIKNGVYRAVAKEVRDFLEHTNLAEELTQALTTLSFEIKMEVRFIPNDARPSARPVPDVKTKVSVKRDRMAEEPVDEKLHEGASQNGRAVARQPPSEENPK